MNLHQNTEEDMWLLTLETILFFYCNHSYSEKLCILNSVALRNPVFVAVFLLIKGEYKTSVPYKWFSKAKTLQNASYLVIKCDVLEQNSYFWDQHPKISEKRVLDFIQQIQCWVLELTF